MCADFQEYFFLIVRSMRLKERFGGGAYLVTSPEKSSNEENHADDRKESTDEINTSNDFSIAQTR